MRVGYPDGITPMPVEILGDIFQTVSGREIETYAKWVSDGRPNN